MATPALAAMDWTALYKHLAKLRADLEKTRRRTPVDMQRYRALRQQISECTTEIARYHQRQTSDGSAPRGRSSQTGPDQPIVV